MLRRLFICLSLFVLPMPANADVALENLTWMELRDAIAGGVTTVIVPIGGTEQSGPHLALGKHNERVNVLANAIAEKLGHTLVAPVVTYVPEGKIDPPTEHMKFPGTISISDATFISTLEDAGRSLRHAGFKYVVFIGDHGSYQHDLPIAAAALNKEWKGQGKAIGLTRYYELAQEPYQQALIAAGAPKDEIGTHAALGDTALELATVPAMVRIDKMQDKSLATAANGVYGGTPVHATKELGQSGVNLIVSGTITAIQNFMNSDNP